MKEFIRAKYIQKQFMKIPESTDSDPVEQKPPTPPIIRKTTKESNSTVFLLDESGSCFGFVDEIDLEAPLRSLRYRMEDDGIFPEGVQYRFLFMGAPVTPRQEERKSSIECVSSTSDGKISLKMRATRMDGQLFWGR